MDGGWSPAAGLSGEAVVRHVVEEPEQDPVQILNHQMEELNVQGLQVRVATVKHVLVRILTVSNGEHRFKML